MKTEVTENIFEQAWDGFKGTNWRDKASVTRFVQENYKPYDGDESFLAGPTERTLKVKKIIEDTKNHYEEVGFFVSSIIFFTLSVRSVGPARKLSSPSYGL